MHASVEKTAAHLLIRSGLLPAIEHQDAARADVLRILLYHRVGRPAEQDDTLDPSLLSATPEQFAEQMTFLADHYHLVSVQELVWTVETGHRLPASSAAVTFDDGYCDFLTGAWPVLQRLQIPAVLFVATEHLSDTRQRFWWDRLYEAFARTQCAELDLDGSGCFQLGSAEQRWLAFCRLKALVKSMEYHRAMDLVEAAVAKLGVCTGDGAVTLNWEEVASLSAQGLAVAAHTRSHPVLSHVPPEEARAEILGSQADLAERLGQAWPVFAYPCGHAADICPGLISILQEGGFRAAMTCIEGHNVLHRSDPLLLRRVSLAPHLSLDEFRLVLAGIFDIYAALHRLRHQP